MFVAPSGVRVGQFRGASNVFVRALEVAKPYSALAQQTFMPGLSGFIF